MSFARICISRLQEAKLQSGPCTFMSNNIHISFCVIVSQAETLNAEAEEFARSHLVWHLGAQTHKHTRRKSALHCRCLLCLIPRLLRMPETHFSVFVPLPQSLPAHLCIYIYIFFFVSVRTVKG